MADPVATMNGQEGDEEVSLPLQDGTGDESGDQDKLDMETKDDMQSEEEKGDGEASNLDSKMEGFKLSIQGITRAMEMIGMHQGPAKSLEEAGKKHYQFWETQPVPQFSEKAPDIDNGPIVKERPAKHELRQEPYSLPQGFQWDTLDINSPDILHEVYVLLSENYVEDDDNMFRFDYSQEFLQWALQPPGWESDWHCGVRVGKSKKLVCFISAVPATIRIYDKEEKMVEINFLCVHKKLRSKRVAPVLIKEITRRVNLKGIFQAMYTGGVVLPKPVATCRYWHRSLNPRKLIEVKFSHLTRNMTMKRTLQLYRLPEHTKTPGFREMQRGDIKRVHKLLQEALRKYSLAPVITKEDCEHWFLPRQDIVNSYVVETQGKITDFASFYTLPSTVMHHPTHKQLKAAYSFYNASTKTPWVDLIQDALITAKNLSYDVFNALDLMENTQFLEELKFGVGDGNLHYYLYNWRCQPMTAEQVGIVLL